MQKKSVLVILLTVLVFLSACALGVSTVYRVGEVTVQAETLSAEAETEAVQLKEKLQQAYAKDSIFSIDEEKAETVLAEFPYFRITAIEKVYPNRLIFNVSEDEEVYAVATQAGDGYYILNGEGTILSIREDYTNRKETVEEAKNLLLAGLTVTGEKGQKLVGDENLAYVFSFVQRANESLGGIRRNFVSVELVKGGSSLSTYILKIKTVEGVVIYVRDPSSKTVEKAEKAVTEYLALPDGAHAKGMLAVYEQDGNVATRYSPTDDFAEN